MGSWLFSGFLKSSLVAAVISEVRSSVSRANTLLLAMEF